MSEPPSPSASPLDRFLRLFSDVRGGEAPATLLLLANIFALMVAYYVIKVVREALVLTAGVEGIDGPQLKAMAAGVQAVVLMAAVPLYGQIANRFPARWLTRGVTLFFVLSFELFGLLAWLEMPLHGFFFYVWVGIFSVVTIAQFWSYANDIFTEEAGDRLFPIIAVGATGGAFLGSKLSGWLADRDISAIWLVQLGAAVLVLQLGLYALVQRRPEVGAHGGGPTARAVDREAIGGPGGFRLVAESRYLRLIALLLILLNLVNTTGEYILSASANDAAQRALAAALLEDPSLDRTAFLQSFFASFYGGFYFWVNWIALLLQAFGVSRLFRYGGLPAVVLILPLVSFAGYGLIAAGAAFAVVRIAKTAENATDYSVMNTAKALLWLPTSRAEKYKAKQAIDTFFVRVGDVLALGVVMVGTEGLHLGLRGFAAANVAVASMWLVVGVLLVREHRKLHAEA